MRSQRLPNDLCKPIDKNFSHFALQIIASSIIAPQIFATKDNGLPDNLPHDNCLPG